MPAPKKRYPLTSKLDVRMTETMRAKLDRKAKKASVTAGEYVRGLIKRAVK